MLGPLSPVPEPSGEDFVTGYNVTNLDVGRYEVELTFSTDMLEVDKVALSPLMSFTVNGQVSTLEVSSWLDPTWLFLTFQAPTSGATRQLSYTTSPSGLKSLTGTLQSSFIRP